MPKRSKSANTAANRSPRKSANCFRSSARPTPSSSDQTGRSVSSKHVVIERAIVRRLDMVRAAEARQIYALSTRLSSSWLFVMALIAVPGAAPAAEPIEQQQLRERAQQAITLIERSAGEYLVQRECFSCHHQAMAILTCMEAR